MPMSDATLARLLVLYTQELSRDWTGDNVLEPKRGPVDLSLRHWSHRQICNHLVWMLQQVRDFVEDGRREKAMRWLGFVQAALVTHGYFTIAQCADHNKGDPDADARDTA